MTWHAGAQRAISEPPAAPGDLILRQPGRRRARVTGTTAGPSVGPPEDRGNGLHAYWLSPPGLIMLAATGLAVAVRLYVLTRLRYLTGITEYDDAVYLGGAVSLLSGLDPYHGFAFVQPPGILLLMAPAALVAKVSAVSSAMAVARLLTALASAACVTLTGSLVRHRGPWVTLVACGVLAVYPDDIMAAHTLLLEPWMNLLLLAGACLAFRGGRLSSPRRLLWAGVLFGLAGAVKYWAVLPALALLACCLFSRPDGTVDEAPALPRMTRPAAATRRAIRFGTGAITGFAVPVLPFAAPWPGVFVRSTLLDQVSRAGSPVPESLRLAHLTGLADLLNDAGRLTVPGDASSLFARGDVTAAATWATGWLPAGVAVVLAALIGLGYVVGHARARPGDAADAGADAWTGATSAGPGPLGWYALGTLAAALVAVLAYSAFFYHYADFAAPWLAIASGYAAGALRPRQARLSLAAIAAAFIVVASFQAWELSGLYAPNVQADAALIPPGSCVVTDEISLAIAANRFTAGSGGCPDVLDSLATTLVASNGVSVQAGAKALPRVVATWKDIFERAQYVWLSGASDRRVPWTIGLQRWFARTYRPLNPAKGQFSEGNVYVRRAIPIS